MPRHPDRVSIDPPAASTARRQTPREPTLSSDITPARRALLITLLSGLAGCAVSPSSPTGPRPQPADAARASEVVIRAMSLIGVDYRWGGSEIDTGLDCSGLVQRVYLDAADLRLPRRAEEQGRRGISVPVQWLEPADLVFFNTVSRPFSHVGIFIGDDRFVHAPRTGGKVRLERLSSGYWQSRFDGGRRLLVDRGGPRPLGLAD